MRNFTSKLYNPTPYEIIGQFDGQKYYFGPGESMTLPEETAWWILTHREHYGIVCIDVEDEGVKKDATKFTNHIVRKAVEGLTKLLETLHNAAESFIKLDTELKEKNQHGTVLRGKDIRAITEQIETVTHMIADLEKKYKVSITKQDYADRAKKLMGSIEAQVAEFEADEEAKALAAEEEKEITKIVDSINKGVMPNATA